MVALVTTLRFQAAVDRSLTAAGAGEAVLEWRWFHRAGDARLDLHAEVASGTWALEVDGTELAQFTSGSTYPLQISLSGVSVGPHEITIRALTAGQLDLVEIHSVKVEVR